MIGRKKTQKIARNLLLIFFFIFLTFVLISARSFIHLSNNAEAVTSTVSFTPIADTHVRADLPNNNYGLNQTLEVDGSPIKITYMKLDLSSLAGSFLVSAKLRLKITDSSTSTQVVKTVDDTGWSETTMTYTNRPPVGTSVNIIPGGTAGTWVEVDISSAVSSKLGQLLSIAIDSVGSDGLDFYSKDNATDKPVLVINVDDTPLPTSTPTPTATPIPTLAPGVEPVAAAAGDIVCDPIVGGSCKHIATSDLVLQINPNAVFALGDNQYESGQYTNFISYYDPSWGRFKGLTHPSVGNHEYLTAGAAGYFDYFNGVGNFSGQAGDRDKGYYSFDIGTWHGIVLNSNCSKVGGCGAGSAQEKWLRADLASHTATCTIAYFHHPRFSSGNHGSQTSVKALWQALYDYNADVVLSGHDHDYERFAPQDPNGTLDLLRGVREFIVGTGGKNHTHLGTSGRIANSEVFDDTSFGVIKLTLHPTSYDWVFIPIPGNSFTDSGTQQCH